MQLQLVSPGSWLCELTLERYEVREKKVSKKVLYMLISLSLLNKFYNNVLIDLLNNFSETSRVEGYGKHGIRFRVIC